MMLLDQVRNKLRLLHYSYRTEQSFMGWIERYFRFHKRRGPEAAALPAEQRWRHPRELAWAKWRLPPLTREARQPGRLASPGGSPAQEARQRGRIAWGDARAGWARTKSANPVAGEWKGWVRGMR